MKEIWKDINGYEGIYQISNLGNLKSLDRECYNSRYGSFKREGGLMKTPLNSDGYPYCTLSKNGVPRTYKVHRLVAEAFISKDDQKKFVNHKDGIKSNNKVSNLEWCTHSENIKHAFEIGLNKSKNGEDHYRAKLTKKDVLEIRKIFNDPQNNLTKKEVAKKYGVTDVSISYIVLRKTWKDI